MPALTLTLLGICLGGLCSWSAASDLRQRPSAVRSDAAWVVLLYSVLLWGPCVGLLLSSYTDWALSYWVRSEALSTGLLSALMLGMTFGPLGGYLLGAPLAKRRRAAPLLVALGCVLGACLVLTLLTLPRVLVVGSTLQFEGEFGLQNITGSGLGYALLWCAVVVTGATLWSIGALRKLHTADPTARLHAADQSAAALAPAGLASGGLASAGLGSRARIKTEGRKLDE